MNTTRIRLALAGAFVLALASAERASAALITVTTKADVVADDGNCSLREAVTAANTNKASGRSAGECPPGDREPFVDVIQLRRGRYKLKRGPVGEDANRGGDLDVTESFVVQGRKSKATVIQNAIGSPGVMGDGDRLFHVDPKKVGGVNVTFRKLALARGDVGCSGQLCDAGASVVDARGSGSLTFDGCTIMRGTATCSGESCGTPYGGAAIAALGGGSLTIRGSIVKENISRCTDEGCNVAGTILAANISDAEVAAPAAQPSRALVLEDSVLTQNAVSCQGDFCGAGSLVGVEMETISVRNVDVTSSSTGCSGAECQARGLLQLFGFGRSSSIEELEVRGNEGTCHGNGCLLGNAVVVEGQGSTAIRDVDLESNPFSCTGARCFVDHHYFFGAHTDVVASGVGVRSDVVGCTGIGCAAQSLLHIESPGAADVFDVSVTESELTCLDEDCAVGTIASFLGVPVRGERNRLSDNVVGCDGDRCRAEGLLQIFGVGNAELAQATITRNRLLCSGAACVARHAINTFSDDADLALPNLLVESNRLICVGPGCTVWNLLAASAPRTLSIASPRIALNELLCVGDACQLGGVGNLDAMQIVVEDGVVTGNGTRCDGSACRAAGALQIGAGEGALRRMLITSNVAQCDGEGCSAGPGGALRNSSVRLDVVDATFVANKTDSYGAAVFNDAGSALLLERVYLTSNETGLRGTMEFGGHGGAIFNDAASGTRGVLTLIDSEIAQNRALRTGGGVLNEGTIARIVRSTIAQNSIGDCTNRGGTGCP